MIEGKLYKCPDYYLMIYPTEEKAAALSTAILAQLLGATAVAAAQPSRAAAEGASYWSKRLNCTVRFSEPNETFMYLNESKDEFAHVLFGEKQGWIINRRWLKIEGIEQ